MELCTYNEIKKQKCVIHVIICLNTIFTADKSLMTIERHGMAQIEFLISRFGNAIYNYFFPRRYLMSMSNANIQTYDKEFVKKLICVIPKI